MVSDGAYVRALEKKLRQITDLKRQRDEQGEGRLDAAQRQKLSREAELQALLDGARAQASSDAAAAPQLECGGRVRVDGRRAKVKRLEGSPPRKVRVRFLDDRSVEWLQLPDMASRLDRVRPPKRKTHAAEPATVPSSLADDMPAPIASSRVAAPDKQLASAPAGGGACNHCGRVGHTPRLCTYGLADHEEFLPCAGAGPDTQCFHRTFIVPLRRASAAFDEEGSSLRAGRVDVGLRCVSSALFRSQSLRQNSRVLLCFMGTGATPSSCDAVGEGSWAASGAPSGPAPCESAARVVEVNGALVRDLRPDEASLARRLRAVSDPAGGASAAAAREAAAREAAGARRAAAPAAQHAPKAAVAAGMPPSATIPDDGALGRWSRGETRGMSSREGDLLAAVRDALFVRGTNEPPPMLLLLAASGEFIGELCARLAAAAKARQDAARASGAPLQPGPFSGVVVLLGDDRGLEAHEERAVLGLARQRGSEVCRVSLGADMLFASHSIVLVHHYLDRHLHSCLVRPPRVLVRGGGRGGQGRGRGRGC